jgi:hypothetical protein
VCFADGQHVVDGHHDRGVLIGPQRGRYSLLSEMSGVVLESGVVTTPDLILLPTPK